MGRDYLIDTEADNKGRRWRAVRERLGVAIAVTVCILPLLVFFYWSSARSSATHECRLVVGNSTLKHDCNTNAGEIVNLIGGRAHSFIQHIRDSYETELDQERKRAIADATRLQTAIDRAVAPSSLLGFQVGHSQRKIEKGPLCLLMQGDSVDTHIRPQFTDACSNPLLKFRNATKYIESEGPDTHRQGILRYFVIDKEAVGQDAAAYRLRQLVADELSKRAIASGVTIGPVRN